MRLFPKFRGLPTFTDADATKSMTYNFTDADATKSMNNLHLYRHIYRHRRHEIDEWSTPLPTQMPRNRWISYIFTDTFTYADATKSIMTCTFTDAHATKSMNYLHLYRRRCHEIDELPTLLPTHTPRNRWITYTFTDADATKLMNDRQIYWHRHHEIDEWPTPLPTQMPRNRWT